MIGAILGGATDEEVEQIEDVAKRSDLLSRFRMMSWM